MLPPILARVVLYYVPKAGGKLTVLIFFYFTRLKSHVNTRVRVNKLKVD